VWGKGVLFSTGDVVWGGGSAPFQKIDFFQLKCVLVHLVKQFCSDIETAEYQLYCGFRCKFNFS